jgi:hypothetical protein
MGKELDTKIVYTISKKAIRAPAFHRKPFYETPLYQQPTEIEFKEYRELMEEFR